MADNKPENYDGRESEEPQVWSMEPFRRNRKKTYVHNPCGHWHLPSGGGETGEMTIETYIELLSSGTCLPSQCPYPVNAGYEGEDGPLFDVTFYSTYRPLNTAEYDGTVTYTFEVVCCNVSEVNSGFVYLVDGSDNIIATIEVPKDTRGPYTQYSDGTGSSDGYRANNYYVFSTTFTPTAGSQQYGLRTAIANTGYLSEWDPWSAIIKVANARIVIRQAGAAKSVVHIPMMVNTNACNMAYAALALGSHYVSDGFETGGSDITNEDYADCDSGDFVDECRQIWKYDSTELAALSGVVFDVGVIMDPKLGIQTGYLPGGIWGTPTLTWVQAQLRVCDTACTVAEIVSGNMNDAVIVDANGKQLTLLSSDIATWYYSEDGAGWEETHSYDPDVIEAATGKYLCVVAYVNVYGGEGPSGPLANFGSFLKLNVTSGREVNKASARWYYYYDPDRFGHEIHVTYTHELAPAAPDTVSAILYDRTAGTYVAGSELVWTEFSVWSRKSATLAASLFTSGHEYQARWKVSGANCYNYCSDINLWMKVGNISAFTSFLRVAKGSITDWQYGGVYEDWAGDGFYLDPTSRAKPYIPSGAKVYYECCAAEIYSDDPMTEGVYETGDNTDGAAGTSVSGADIPVRSTDAHTKRFRSAEITGMRDGKWHIANVYGDAEDYHYILSGFIMVKQTA
jgi:hypothetical protein